MISTMLGLPVDPAVSPAVSLAGEHAENTEESPAAPAAVALRKTRRLVVPGVEITLYQNWRYIGRSSLWA
jgi:hypothetical protein